MLGFINNGKGIIFVATNIRKGRLSSRITTVGVVSCLSGGPVDKAICVVPFIGMGTVTGGIECASGSCGHVTSGSNAVPGGVMGLIIGCGYDTCNSFRAAGPNKTPKGSVMVKSGGSGAGDSTLAACVTGCAGMDGEVCDCANRTCPNTLFRYIGGGNVANIVYRITLPRGAMAAGAIGASFGVVGCFLGCDSLV